MNKPKNWRYTGTGNRRTSKPKKVQMRSFSIPEELKEQADPLIESEGYAQFMTEAIKLYIAVQTNTQDEMPRFTQEVRRTPFE